MDDLISRQAAIDAVRASYDEILDFKSTGRTVADSVEDILTALPSAQPESLTDKEQRIFLAAMAREEKVCKQVDEECRDCREPHDDSLVGTCHEIERKVKGALWT